MYKTKTQTLYFNFNTTSTIVNNLKNLFRNLLKTKNRDFYYREEKETFRRESDHRSNWGSYMRQL